MTQERFFLRKADGKRAAAQPLLKDINAFLPALIESATGEKPDAIGPVHAGTFHDVYPVRLGPKQWVIKIPRTSGAAASLALEASLYRRLGRAVTGIELIAVDAGTASGPPFLIISQAAGVLLRSIDIDATDYGQYVRGVAATLALLHRQPVGAGGYGPVTLKAASDSGAYETAHATWQDYLDCNLEEHLQVALHYQAITAEEAGMIKQCLAGLKYSTDAAPVLLHGDLGPHNIFVDTSTHAVSALIDWEDALIGDGLFDAAMFASFYRMDEFTEELLEAYARARGLDAGALRPRFWGYYLRIALAKVAVRYRQGHDRAGQASASTPKIKRALAQWQGLRKI